MTETNDEQPARVIVTKDLLYRLVPCQRASRLSRCSALAAFLNGKRRKGVPGRRAARHREPDDEAQSER